MSDLLVTALGGVRGWQNLAAWGVAGTAAYFLWVRPEQARKRQIEEKLRIWREVDAERYAEKVTPRADPQVSTGYLLKASHCPRVRTHTEFQGTRVYHGLSSAPASGDPLSAMGKHELCSALVVLF